MNDITASEFYLVRLMRDSAHLACEVANLRTAIKQRDAEIEQHKATIARQKEAIEHLTARVQVAEGQR